MEQNEEIKPEENKSTVLKVDGLHQSQEVDNSSIFSKIFERYNNYTNPFKQLNELRVFLKNVNARIDKSTKEYEIFEELIEDSLKKMKEKNS